MAASWSTAGGRNDETERIDQTRAQQSTVDSSAAFQQERLHTEASGDLLERQIIDGRIGTPALFDVDEHAASRQLRLERVQLLSDGLLCLRYEVVGA